MRAQKAKVQDMERQLGEQAQLLQRIAEEKAQLEAQVALLQQEGAAVEQRPEDVLQQQGMSGHPEALQLFATPPGSPLLSSAEVRHPWDGTFMRQSPW